jgi:hypothetical protein
MKIYCCKCEIRVEANLKTGNIVYNNRPDLKHLYFWVCPNCYNFVGTHKTSKTHKPFGFIPTPHLKAARKHIHGLLDPLWKKGKCKRVELYKKISDVLGWEYHTAEIKSIDEARKVYKIVLEIKREVLSGKNQRVV